MTSKTARKFLGARVSVTWADIETTGGWVEDLDSLSSPLCETLGFVVRVTSKDLILASTRQLGKEEFGDTSAIPLGTVRKIEHV